MKVLLTLLIALIINPLTDYAQSDTLYYNINWKKTVKDSAAYYRTLKLNNDRYKVEDHYLNNILQMSGGYLTKKFGTDSEVQEGYFVYYDSSGNKESEGEMVNNKRNGLWIKYLGNAIIWIKENYKNGILEGKLTSYYPGGNLKREEDYVNDKIISGKCFLENGEKADYYPFQKLASPTFDINVYLANNLVYPVYCRNHNIEGKIIVQFIVDEKGHTTDVQVVKSVFPMLDSAAIDVVKNMPRWIPGYIDGALIKTKYNLPVNFKLTD